MFFSGLPTLKREAQVLFVCVHNSARSQMAEAFLKELCPNDFTAESAGLEPGTLNPRAVAVMREIGNRHLVKPYQECVRLFVRAGRHFTYVITVCDETSAESCPVFPAQARRIHWSFADPAALQGPWGRATRTGTRHSRRDSREGYRLVR